jgi:hypothetical protein
MYFHFMKNDVLFYLYPQTYLFCCYAGILLLCLATLICDFWLYKQVFLKMSWLFDLLAVRLPFPLCFSLLFFNNCWASDLAIFYGKPLPVNELSLYQRVVVQADQTSPAQLQQLTAYDVQVLAYLSLGEGHPQDIVASSAKSLAKNFSWNSLVMDLTDANWQRHVLQQAEELLAQGYQGFFLDTLDSYWLAEISAEELNAQQQALAELIHKLKTLGAKVLIQNRGFELLDDTHQVIDAIAAESFFAGYNVAQDSYKLVNESDRQWLIAQFDKASEMGLETIAIDYVKTHQDRAEIADKIKALGITPWVADGHLTQLGTGNLRPVARRVLIAYDSRQENFSHSIGHQQFVPHLEYLGYLPEYIDIAEEKWPQADPALYAGALFYLSSSQYSEKLLKQLSHWQHHIPLLFLNDLPTDDIFLQNLGIKLTDVDKKGKIVFKSAAPWSFEANINDVPSWMHPQVAIQNINSENQIHLSLKNKKQQAALAITGPWGGVVLQPALFLPLPEEQLKWLHDPIKLLRQGLQLADLPVADITTENGRRIMTSHIDGDGFVSRAKYPGSPMAAEVMLKQLIEPYHLPITVSVIEGEVGPKGLYPKDSAAAEALAREIFAKPYVEIASHSFSHPFFWGEVPTTTSLDDGFHLPIKNYQLSIEREIIGSINYINEHLTTKEKPVSIMLWTGEAMPEGDAIAYTKKIGVLNVNGGNTKLIKGQDSLTNLWPIGRPLKQGIQVYAPIMNENFYTELWQGAHFGYQRVLETYQLTDQPRRYKPVSIYYHFYSAEDPAGIRALKRVYDDVLTQHIFPMFLSDYARKAEEFYHYGLAKTPSGEWFTKLNYINTLRISKTMGLPLLNDTNHVIGYKDYNESVYVHLNQNVVQVAFQDKPLNTGYLVSSSATLKQWMSHRTGKRTEISFVADSFIPFELVLSHPGKCRLSVEGIEYQSRGSKNRHHFQLANAVSNKLMTIICQ